MSATSCHACGTSLAPAARFCGNCGLARFNAPVSSSAPTVAASYLRPQAAAATALADGTILDSGRYQIVRLINAGAFGTVYEGKIQRVGLSCAIKELCQSGRTPQEQAEAEAWFVREAEVLMDLHHPMIPRIMDRFDEGGRHYLVMDLVAGRNLEQELAAWAPLPEEEVLRWGHALCDVLGYMHGRQPPMIFRDLKPANVMRTPQGALFLIDFGIARMLPAVGLGGTLRPGTTIGTPGYAPPEQYQGLAEPRSDIYALGVMLYRLLTAYDVEHSPPFSFPPARQLRSDLSDQLEAVLMQAMAFKLDERFPDASAMATAMNRMNSSISTVSSVATQIAPANTMVSSTDRSFQKSYVKGVLLHLSETTGALIILFDTSQIGETVRLRTHELVPSVLNKRRNYVIRVSEYEGLLTELAADQAMLDAVVSEWTINGSNVSAAVFRSVAAGTYVVVEPNWAANVMITVAAGKVTEEDWR